jgi:hypothetical protein
MERRPSLKERRTQRTNAVAAPKRPTKTTQPVETPQPKPAIKPGKISYLDYKNGFRDVCFFQQESSFTNLVLRTQDDQRQLKTFMQSGEELSLGGVPLERVEYHFFKGQLYLILIEWRVEQKDGAQKAPPAATLAPFCTSLYGPPDRHAKKKGETELRWRGQRVELTLSESVIPGVRDKINGGWAIPPTASGQMVIENIALRKALAATLVSATERRKDGL